jgi:hypothetical protein
MERGERPRNNCVSYVCRQVGLIQEERYISPPTLKSLLRRFDRTSDLESASVMAIIYYGRNKPVVEHIALLNGDKQTVIHRDGVNGRVRPNDALDEITEHTFWPLYKVVYLKPKPVRKPLRFFW